MPLACLALPSASMTASPLPKIFEAQLFHDPTMLGQPPFGRWLGVSECLALFFFSGRGAGESSTPPETDLFCLPMLPPMLPPCANDGEAVAKTTIAVAMNKNDGN